MTEIWASINLGLKIKTSKSLEQKGVERNSENSPTQRKNSSKTCRTTSNGSKFLFCILFFKFSFCFVTRGIFLMRKSCSTVFPSRGGFDGENKIWWVTWLTPPPFSLHLASHYKKRIHLSLVTEFWHLFLIWHFSDFELNNCQLFNGFFNELYCKPHLNY